MKHRIRSENKNFGDIGTLTSWLGDATKVVIRLLRTRKHEIGFCVMNLQFD